MPGEFPDYESLGPREEPPFLTEAQVREALRVGAENARAMAKLLREDEDRAINSGIMNLVLR